MWVYSKRILVTLNVFKKESSISIIENSNEMAVIATRFYLTILTASMIVLVFFNSFRQRTVSVTIQTPSLATFEQLHDTYTVNLLCSCGQITIPHSTILSLSASYHQVSNTNTESLVNHSNIWRNESLQNFHEIVLILDFIMHYSIDECQNNFQCRDQVIALWSGKLSWQKWKDLLTFSAYQLKLFWKLSF